MAYYRGLDVIEVSLQKFLNEVSEEERETDKHIWCVPYMDKNGKPLNLLISGGLVFAAMRPETDKAVDVRPLSYKILFAGAIAEKEKRIVVKKASMKADATDSKDKLEKLRAEGERLKDKINNEAMVKMKMMRSKEFMENRNK